MGLQAGGADVSHHRRLQFRRRYLSERIDVPRIRDHPGNREFSGQDLDDPAILCASLPAASNAKTYNGQAGVHRRTNGAEQICVSLGVGSGIVGTSSFKEYLNSNPIDIFVKRPPIETDITDLVPPDWNYLQVEGGGEVEFKTSHGLRLEMPNTIKFQEKI